MSERVTRVCRRCGSVAPQRLGTYMCIPCDDATAEVAEVEAVTQESSPLRPEEIDLLRIIPEARHDLPGARMTWTPERVYQRIEELFAAPAHTQEEE